MYACVSIFFFFIINWRLYIFSSNVDKETSVSDFVPGFGINEAQWRQLNPFLQLSELETSSQSDRKEKENKKKNRIPYPRWCFILCYLFFILFSCVRVLYNIYYNMNTCVLQVLSRWIHNSAKLSPHITSNVITCHDKWQSFSETAETRPSEIFHIAYVLI